MWCSPLIERLTMHAARRNSDTHPYELDDGAEFQLLLVVCQGLDRGFDPGPTQASHHLQEMTPIRCLDVERHIPPKR